jgi:hypothetical protein
VTTVPGAGTEIDRVLGLALALDPTSALTSKDSGTNDLAAATGSMINDRGSKARWTSAPVVVMDRTTARISRDNQTIGRGAEMGSMIVLSFKGRWTTDLEAEMVSGEMVHPLATRMVVRSTDLR